MDKKEKIPYQRKTVSVEQFNQLSAQVKDLTDLVITLSKNQSKDADVNAKQPEEAIVKQQEKPATPVPMEYRQIVHDILNRAFGVEIEPRPDLPGFTFSVLVPRKYSNAAPAYWETYKEDRRPRFIQYADGTNGVREWVERVFKNFNPDIQALIVADRVQTQ